MPSWNAGAKSSIRTGLGGPKLALGAKRPSLPESMENVSENVDQDEGNDRSLKRQKVEHGSSLSITENEPPAAIPEKIEGVEQPRSKSSTETVPAKISEGSKPATTTPPESEVEEDDGNIVINVADENYESKTSNEQPVQDSSHVRHVTRDDQTNAEAEKQPDNVSSQVDPVELESDSDSESDSENETVPSLDEDDSEDSNSSNSSDDEDEDSGSEDDESDASMADEAELKSEGDAMQIYSSSNPQDTIDLTTDSDHQLTLASLSYDDLILQIRYFHVGKPLSSIDAATPVRCLTCTGPGHMADSCPSFKCSTCRSNEHMRYKCPTLKRCNKCRQPGHEEASCSSKLKVPLEQIICALCENKGHFEDECEVIWRTSLIQSYSSPAVDVENSVRLFCYECSSGGHLGNDCPTRRPRKPLGSSSWTTKGNYGAVLRRSVLPPPKSSGPKTAPPPVASNSKQRVKAVPVSKATSIQIKGFANNEEDEEEYEPPPLIVTQHHHNNMPHAAGSTSFSVKGAAKGPARPGQANQKGGIKINIQDGKGKAKGR